MFEPFKPYYNSALDSWMMTNPGIPVTIFQIAKCVGYAFDNSMTPNNIKAGSRKCRIVPLHDFEDNYILMSSATIREEPLEESQAEITVEAHASNSDFGVLKAHASNGVLEVHASSADHELKKIFQQLLFLKQQNNYLGTQKHSREKPRKSCKS